MQGSASMEASHVPAEVGLREKGAGGTPGQGDTLVGIGWRCDKITPLAKCFGFSESPWTSGSVH